MQSDTVTGITPPTELPVRKLAAFIVLTALGHAVPSVAADDGKQYVATTSGVISGFHGGTGTSALVVPALP